MTCREGNELDSIWFYVISVATALLSHRFKDSAESLLFSVVALLFPKIEVAALCAPSSWKARGAFSFNLELTYTNIDLTWSSGWYREVLFEELSPALSEWFNRLNLAVGAMSAAAQVGGWAKRSELLSPLSLYWGSLYERPVAMKKPAA